MSCLYKGKLSIFPIYITSPYNAFFYFLKDQVYKDTELGIITNVSLGRLIKAIFANIHKMNGACAFLLDTS